MHIHSQRKPGNHLERQARRPREKAQGASVGGGGVGGDRRPGLSAGLLSLAVRWGFTAGLKGELGGRTLWGQGRAWVQPPSLQDLEVSPQEPQESGPEPENGR